MADFVGAALVQAVDLASASTLQAPPPPPPTPLVVLRHCLVRKTVDLRLAKAGNLLESISGSHRTRWRAHQKLRCQDPQAATGTVPADSGRLANTAESCALRSIHCCGVAFLRLAAFLQESGLSSRRPGWHGHSICSGTGAWYRRGAHGRRPARRSEPPARGGLAGGAAYRAGAAPRAGAAARQHTGPRAGAAAAPGPFEARLREVQREQHAARVMRNYLKLSQ